MRENHRATLFPILVAWSLVGVLALPAVAAEEIALEVYLHEVGDNFHILPPDINAKVGDTLRLTVQNAGTSPHDLLVCGEPPKPQITCDHVLARTGSLAPQAAQVLTFTLEEPGEFEYFGTGFGEKEGQMRGYLHVTGEAKKETPLSPVLALSALALVAVAGLVLRRRSP